MPSRDSQTVILSRQTILLVTAVGVGLLTLCYVLGVQVGKQSAALRGPAARGSGEDLQELPASVAEQLLSLDTPPDAGFRKPVQAPVTVPPASPQPASSQPTASQPAASKPAAPKPAAPKPAAPQPAAPQPSAARPAAQGQGAAATRWTLQLISTPDAAEAERMAAKAKAAGFPTATISEKGLFKVRLAAPGPREAVDGTALKLKNRGFKPFAIKVE